MNRQDTEMLIEQIRSIILDKPIETQLSSEEEYVVNLQEAMSYLAKCLSESNQFLRDLAKGNLDVTPPSRHNFLSGNLKELHSGLKHLTWQVGQVANGDYNQKVSFLGDFSDSFNAMVKQLAEREINLIEKQEYIERLAYSDELTGLYNRRYCIQTLEGVLGEKKDFIFCMIDMDGLKRANDVYGHLQGDWYLSKVSDEIKGIVAVGDKACRLGGDEFAVIFDGRSKEEVETLMRQINVNLKSMEKPYPMSISYGIIYVDSVNEMYNIEKVFGEADHIMYEYKRKKKEFETKNCSL